MTVKTNNSKRLNYTVWIEKYRPDSVETTLLPANLKTLFNKFVEEGEVPSLLFYSSSPGVGKTTLASTLPAGETLIINTEAGYGPLLGTGHIVFNLDQDLKQLETLYQWIRVHDHPFKNVVIDNISEMQDWMTRSLTDGRGKDFASISEYGDASSKMKEYLTLFRDLTTERGMNDALITLSIDAAAPTSVSQMRLAA